MPKLSLPLTLLALLMLPLPASAQDMPSWDLSYATMAYQGNETPTLFVLPNGTGNPFSEAYLPNGDVVDATITLHVYDEENSPYTTFIAREDLWLVAIDGGLIGCNGPVLADSGTSPGGIAFWSYPLEASGYSLGPLQIFMFGMPLTSSPGINLRIISVDITGDHTVNLADVGIFAGDYFGTYHFRSDFHCDGDLDLLDVQKLARAVGITCR